MGHFSDHRDGVDDVTQPGGKCSVYPNIRRRISWFSLLRSFLVTGVRGDKSLCKRRNESKIRKESVPKRMSPSNECRRYDAKHSDFEASVMLEFWGLQSTLHCYRSQVWLLRIEDCVDASIQWLESYIKKSKKKTDFSSHKYK